MSALPPAAAFAPRARPSLAARRAGRSSGGRLSWQTMLADLALILFMVTAAAMGQNPRTASPHAITAPAPQPPTPQPTGEPVAVWRAGPGAPPLSRWLAGQQGDARLLLTITARYAPGGQGAALAQVSDLARQAGAMGRQARIVVEAAPMSPAPLAAQSPSAPQAAGIAATLAYDQADVQADGQTDVQAGGQSGTRFASPRVPSSKP